MAILSAANADVSHLHQASNGGYQYANLGGLSLHTPERNPAPSQYIHGNYGDNNQAAQLPNSYVPPPSGSPFDSAAPLPQSFTATAAATPSQRLSVPLQSSLLASQRFQTQQNYQQYQTRSIPTPTYQAQTQTYQPQATSTLNSAYTQTQAQAYAQQQQSQEPIVTKHFYVHAAPEDPEEEAGPRFITVGKH